MIREFALPDLGEGLTESEVVAWRIAVGDRIELNQVIADIETAKAIVELPSPFAGIVAALHAGAGDTVEVGAPLLSVDDTAAGSAGPNAAPTDVASEPNLVGYGASADAVAPRRRARGVASAVGDAAGGVLGGAAGGAAGGVPGDDAAGVAGGANPASSAARITGASAERPRSTPPVRTLARELGIDIESLRGTGPNGLITRVDVESAARSGGAGAAGGAGSTSGVADGADGSGDPTGTGGATRGIPTETRTPIKGVRKATAAAMVASAFTAPHVTEFLTVDVTAATELLARLEPRTNVLALTAKAVCIALARNPELNSRWDQAAQQIVHPGTVNLGIAVATGRGLVVPNVKGAERLTLFALADAIRELAVTARDGGTQPPALRGGTFTITNIGVFGIDAGTPILVPGEAGILALGAVRRMPWEHRGEVALRDVLTLSLSFDHRVVDGEQGSRFLADVGAILHDPARVLAMV
ncbi:dihydrolipoamide acetyltransferase family protein [Leifsonia sp. H3M29-4]|uniref:dihydrolipoamide acetyltransferase family protein n=1 Tax=Salinibacterium metalliresistens TaxID=3031321 RepID=UPI0023DA2516|nr:dihydrolipoamide acetyltransferase family protein [Salinibacterium metalliresistens]MDF1479390.1 dihydrolipoamide acetyltransferase family protein [Salinibacterium metalliresistens]